VRRPLDQELVRRGLAGSRDDAREVIATGRVRVAGRPALKDTTLIRPQDPVALSPAEGRFVSRGGEKLAAALDRFDVDPSNRTCLDAGASTGGFTDCLLAAGAETVIAVDVGYGQLDFRLRQDPRVTVMERTNVRELRAGSLTLRPSLVVADLSFISLALALPALAEVSTEDAEFVMLVKPQFEARPQEVETGGVVRDPEVHRRAIEGVANACTELELAPRGVMASPLRGPAGNVEFLLHAIKGGNAAPLDVDAALEEAEA
jgi:23S rRNA (cytidine1920-2'-O)/16S rRNA (cytidine1409-2'-O)-methyltransferase